MKKTLSALTALLTSLYFSSAAQAQAPAPAAADSTAAVPVPSNAAGASGTAPSTPTPTPTPAPASTPAATSPAPAASPTARAHEASPAASPDDRDDQAHSLPRTRDGFYMRLNSGPAFLSLSGDGPTGSASLADSGSSGGFTIGGTIARGLVLAGTVQGTTAQATFKGGPFRNATIAVDGGSVGASHEAVASFGELGLLVDWYPNPAAGWHAGLSAGLGALVIVNGADDSSLVGVSPAGSVFGGYDWAIGRSWSLGLSLAVSGAGAASMKHASGGADAGYQLTPVSVGVQASILYF